MTLQQPELCLPLLHAMQPQDLVNLTLHPEYEKIMKPRLLQVCASSSMFFSTFYTYSPRLTCNPTLQLNLEPLHLRFNLRSHLAVPLQWRDSVPLVMQQLLDGIPLAEAAADTSSSSSALSGSNAATELAGEGGEMGP